MLDKNTDETLDRTEHHSVNHYRAMLFAVLADVLRVKSLRKLEVELNSSALPRSADRIGEVEVDLRAIERTVALVYDVGQFKFVQSLSQRVGGVFPILFRADAVVGAGGKFHVILETEQAVNLVDQTDNAFDFGGYLLGRHINVRVVLSETTNSHKSVELPRTLVTMNESEFAYSHREILITSRFEFINKHSARAVHRFDSVIFVVHLGGVHVFLIMIPVTGSFPKRSRKHYGR